MIFIIGGAFQGQKEYAILHYPEKLRIEDVHQQIFHWMQEGKDTRQEIEKLICYAKEKDAVILTNEIGYGIVPEDAFLRKYREEVGRLCCLIAAEADLVIRVVAGIGVVIKEKAAFGKEG